MRRMPAAPKLSRRAASCAASHSASANARTCKPCRVFSSDVRVRVTQTGFTTYPDASVVCGRLETHAEDKDAIVNPILLIEVLVEFSPM
ncbi:MAG TPA: Uma2 family endonuclease [Polyangiaceae bacterium]